ncbi:hypothetical protein [Polyangium sp. 15x6]|uniref:hypothetical protein n=1 Tax=Polyangium sp. 15x6 TaxID=3042687 RepID=UPI00249B6678|nr:hypothetical protein [Polyangium sp. 15x6]MDI3284657.1 hypothetical protein [Polyangium sp. 15x6]
MSDAAPTTSISPERARFVTRVVRALGAAAIVGLLVGAVTARVVWSGESEIAESTAALRRGDAYEATVRARRAAGWYAPGAPHVRVAYERLASIATTAEGLGDRDLALLAWRGVRTAAIETRWLLVPHKEDLDRANLAIARIEAAAPRPPGTRTEPPQRIEEKQLAALLRDEAPRTPWVVLLLVAFVAWAGGAAWAVRRSSASPDGIDLARARAGVFVALAGVLLWVLALWRA